MSFARVHLKLHIQYLINEALPQIYFYKLKIPHISKKTDNKE